MRWVIPQFLGRRSLTDERHGLPDSQAVCTPANVAQSECFFAVNAKAKFVFHFQQALDSSRECAGHSIRLTIHGARQANIRPLLGQFTVHDMAAAAEPVGNHLPAMRPVLDLIEQVHLLASVRHLGQR